MDIEHYYEQHEETFEERGIEGDEEEEVKMKHAFVKIMEYVTEGDKKLIHELEEYNGIII